jgi:hypothetical protein
MACNPPAQPAAPRAIPAPEESTSGGGQIGSGPKAIVAGVPMPAEVAGVELIEAVEVIAMGCDRVSAADFSRFSIVFDANMA